MGALAGLHESNPYTGYAYAYPHKTAYRPLEPALPLEGLWGTERREALFLYLHVPFCEMRCGYCNLFAAARPRPELVTAYLAALQRQAAAVRAALGPASFARVAIGGGTPTCLDPAGLDLVFDLAERVFGVATGQVSLSVETSPATATPERLALLRARGTTRVSIGVQSFVEAEVHAAGRAQRTPDVAAALDRLRAAGFPVLNIDLIYGLPGQSLATWLTSLEAALRWTPEELYLYPLYVRSLTALGRARRAGADVRVDCYRAGRDFLLAHGYRQISMRLFRAAHLPDDEGPAYCCQEDGMIGLGCGARSYTRSVHYSSEYAVGRAGITAILRDFVRRPAERFAVADYGFVLDAEDQRRRYVIKSILHGAGLDLGAYRGLYGAEAWEDLPELNELEAQGLAEREGGRLHLTPAGLELTDAIGPWLYSEKVKALMRTYALK